MVSLRLRQVELVVRLVWAVRVWPVREMVTVSSLAWRRPKATRAPLVALKQYQSRSSSGLELDSVAGLGVGQGGTAWLGLLTGPGPGDSAFGSRGRQGRAGLADTDT